MRYERDPVDPFTDSALPDMARKGRGAVSNRAGRFESGLRPAEDDGWQEARNAAGDEAFSGLSFKGVPLGLSPRPVAKGGGEDELPPLKTHVALDTARSIISHNKSPDIPFDQSINPYRGCEHGCIYCYARPTHAYLGHSPGLDFETRLYMKADAAKLLEKELRRPGYKPSVIALGANTDPYQPIEKRYGITREVLHVLAAYNHPLGITTKSANVCRDIDILAPMAAKHLAKVYLSVTTLDRDLARVMEPRASTPQKRLDAIRQLSEAGIPVGVSVAPIIPGLTDHEIEAIVEAASAAGATSVSWTLLRLPLEIKDLFQEWLEAHHPLKAKRVLDLVRECRDGALYKAEFGARMKGSGPYATLIRQRVQTIARKLGLNGYRWEVDSGQFRAPTGRMTETEAEKAQLSLFG
ncbi:PA0069 family radical SAM protein [Dongia sp.]|uniref:PA0069 family radical SAM protein n=1 Tax=Dongia sp. TaxID=1977262 RepID=UPI0035B4A4F5